MSNKSMLSYVLLTAVILTLLTIATSAVASQKPTLTSSGEIAGVITDSATGDPVIGASVQILGTSIGGVTDFTGSYRITNVTPGSYTLRITHLAYTAIELSDLLVKADSVSMADLIMHRKTTDIGKTIKVTAKTEIVDKFCTSNQRIISKESRARKPVTTLDRLLTQVAGVTLSESEQKTFIRGGRAGEVSFYTKGRPIGDPLGGFSNMPPAHGGNAIVNGEAFDAMFFKHYGVNPFVDTDDDHLSTFAIDVDDASYVMTRSYINRGSLPPSEAVRTEEFINHFKYNYPSPGHAPFGVTIESGPSMFGPTNSLMLRIGIQGKNIRPQNRKVANLVFVVDVSGSMNRENRLGLVRKGLRLLVDELQADDQVGIVEYGSRGRVVLQPTSVRNRERILSAIAMLQPNGSTNAEEGLRLGYEMADRQFDRRKINRIILCSDGVANVGTTGPDDILKQIKKYADRGITLSAIGFGMGNFNDVLMEKLGDKGNGHYAYVDDLAEARRVFVENLTGMLQVIARDVKIQVDFDDRVVRSYRLLGYENRNVDDNKFRDDKEDGGEIGSGHQVTALYEIKLKENRPRADFGTVFIRYKDATGEEVDEIKLPINSESFVNKFESCSPDFQLAAAAAEFAEILRKSYWARGSKIRDVLQITQQLYHERPTDDLLELMNLMVKADKFEEVLAER